MIFVHIIPSMVRYSSICVKKDLTSILLTASSANVNNNYIKFQYNIYMDK